MTVCWTRALSRREALLAGSFGFRTNISSQPEGLAAVVTAAVPPEPCVLPVDGPLETAPNCEALIPKAKALEGEPIRISRFQAGESQTTARCGNAGALGMQARACVLASCGARWPGHQR